MTALDLDAIKLRAGIAYGAAGDSDLGPASAREILLDSAQDVPALLARIAALEAERDAETHNKDRWHIEAENAVKDLASAERRGYELAVARLRDDARWATYAISQGRGLYEGENTFAADYLEDAAKESNE